MLRELDVDVVMFDFVGEPIENREREESFVGVLCE